MPLTILYWGLMIAWLILSISGWYPVAITPIIFVLFVILGWLNCGPPIQAGPPPPAR